MKKLIRKHKSIFRILVSSVVLLALGLSLLPFQTNLISSAQKIDFDSTDRSNTEARYEQVIESVSNLPVYFEENQGQFDKRAKYLARGTAGYTLFLTPTDAVYVLQEEAVTTEDRREHSPVERMEVLRNEERKPRRAVAVYMSLVGGNEFAASEGVSQLEHRTNYFKGSQENWRTEIPNYAQVRFDEVYAGVDLIWHGRFGGAVQYDFEVAPNGVPEQIEWEIKGAKEVELTAEGDLVIKTEYGEIRHGKPFSYQEADGLRAEVESGFVIRESRSGKGGVRVGFALGDYDRTKPLVIDPTVNLMTSLSYSTFLGGSSNDYGYGIAVDSAGSAYVTGETFSTDFPTTTGAFDTTHNGSFDVFVTKLNAAGSGLVYSTFLGGSDEDAGSDITLDSAGNAFVTGYTFSSDFPTTTGAFDESYNEGNDVFVTKLNAAGSILIYSTFLGEIFNDYGYGIAVDSAGNAYVTGLTFSTDFPTTTGAFDTTHNGNIDVFVTKLNAAGSGLIYSTFLGGSINDVGFDIAVDSVGNAYVTGSTQSTGYPTTTGAFDTSHNGSDDVFVSKLNAAGSGLVYSTFFGESSIDAGYGIVIDSTGNAYVTGYTDSTNFPTTTGAFDTTHNGNIDVFVSKLNATGSGLDYSTFLGGFFDDYGNGIALDGAGNVYVTGETFSSDFPTTTGAFDTSHNGNYDVFVSKLNAAGSTLIYSTFLGGSSFDEGFDIAVDAGNAYVTGFTDSSDFQTTTGAFDTSHNGSDDAFVTKLDLAPTAAEVSIGGRVFDENGYAVRGAIVTLTQADGTTLTYRTNSFGYYRFDEIPVGQTVIVAVRAKGSHYNPQLITVSEELTNLDFSPIP